MLGPPTVKTLTRNAQVPLVKVLTVDGGRVPEVGPQGWIIAGTAHVERLASPPAGDRPQTEVRAALGQRAGVASSA